MICRNRLERYSCFAKLPPSSVVQKHVKEIRFFFPSHSARLSQKYCKRDREETPYIISHFLLQSLCLSLEIEIFEWNPNLIRTILLNEEREKFPKCFMLLWNGMMSGGNQTSVCENVLNVIYADDYLELVLLQVSIHHTWYRNDYRLISQHN